MSVVVSRLNQRVILISLITQEYTYLSPPSILNPPLNSGSPYNNFYLLPRAKIIATICRLPLKLEENFCCYNNLKIC